MVNQQTLPRRDRHGGEGPVYFNGDCLDDRGDRAIAYLRGDNLEEWIMENRHYGGAIIRRSDKSLPNFI